jgi:hypothetical protein
VGGQHHAPAALRSGKIKRLFGPRDLSGRCSEKNNLALQIVHNPESVILCAYEISSYIKFNAGHGIRAV